MLMRSGNRTRPLALGALAISLGLSGCMPEAIILDHLQSALPPGTSASLAERCSPFMGPSVALFDLSTDRANDALLSEQLRNMDGLWSQHESMADFHQVRSQARGPGIGATLLDGKSCLRDLTPDADDILFGDRRGYYYASPPEDVVIVLFGAEPQSGVIFVQAP